MPFQDPKKNDSNGVTENETPTDIKHRTSDVSKNHNFVTVFAKP